MKLAVLVVVALALIGALAYLYSRHIQRQEDAIAAFAIREIDRQDEACCKPHETSECKRYPIGCQIPLEGCKERKDAAEQEWALKYPRQAAQRQENILEEKRRRDEMNMKKQQ